MEEAKGCKHYARRCRILSPCCQQWYPCRLCHNEAVSDETTDCKVETMDRKAISRVRCLECQLEQEQGAECVGCKVTFARYYCPICKLWDDSEKKKIFHCEKCGMCRLGPRELFYHCDGCNVCLSKADENRHKCMNIDDEKCPVCFEQLKASTKGWQLLRCSHRIHLSCL